VRDAPEPMRDELKATVTRELCRCCSVADGSEGALVDRREERRGTPLKAVEVTMSGIELLAASIRRRISS
jgi:hypothetical protein